MIKVELKDPRVVLLVGVVAAVSVAATGANPLPPNSPLEFWARVGLLAFAVLLFALLLAWPYLKVGQYHSVPADAEYEARFRAAEESIKALVPEDQILGSKSINGVKFDLINGNIVDSKSEIIVSSDDNYFSARGGVSKAILQKGGQALTEELTRYRKQKFEQGQLVITTGGAWGRRAIFHPALIDLDENRYPDRDIVSTVVRRCLQCAIALGASSIAFPVLGGGTASKNFKPSESVQTIVDTTLQFLQEVPESSQNFSHIALYIYDKRDAADVRLA